MINPKELLPHSEPFLFVDKIIDENVSAENKTVKAIKYFSGDEYFFKGHFKDNPVLPGVIIVESLAQLSGLLCSIDPGEGNPKKSGMLVSIDKFKFIKSVQPPAEIILVAKEEAKFESLIKTFVTAYFKDELIARGKLTLSIN